jgi:hypothetical protein
VEDIEVTEGLTQGDPLAPFYAQLVYSSVCNKIRDPNKSATISAYIDDVWIQDSPESVLTTFELLVKAFAKEGLQVNKSKCILFTNCDLDDEQAEKCQKLGITTTREGVTILGTPVGTDEFILKELEVEARRVHKLLDMIADVDTIGKVNSRWVTPQGLYYGIRDCVNQMLRHLLRTVNPALTIPAFRPIDEKTKKVVCRILDINIDNEELSTDAWKVVTSRIGLTGRLGGLGVMTYEEVAEAAYVGCMSSLGRRLTTKLGTACWNRKTISGFETAHENVKKALEDASDVLPEIDEVLNYKPQKEDSAGSDKKTKKNFLDLQPFQAKRRNGNSLQHKLTAKLHRRLNTRTY